MTGGSRRPGPSCSDYESLARFRYALRRFLRFSENVARRSGVSPGQYQLMLFVRSATPDSPTVADLAERLQVRHQSAVGLIDRCARAGLVRRRRDTRDARRVRVSLTRSGARLLATLVSEHVHGLADLRLAVPSLDGSRLAPPNGRTNRRGAELGRPA